ncbi:MAG: hypothetical protein AAF431_02740 [Pseudomonadota bacterium]
MRVLLVGISFLLFSSSQLLAQTADSEKALLYVIYDSSNSMWGELSDTSRKYEAGRKAISSALKVDASERDLAFRAYGHRRAGDCRDSELMVAPTDAAAAIPKIQDSVNGVRPTGKTPISYSLRESLKDFGDRKGDILLISDGIETCDIDPCALMDEWRENGVNIRVHVVGVGLNDLERQAMQCVAERGSGNYYDAGSEGEFQAALGEISEIEPDDPEPVEQYQGYALIISGADESGRSLLLNGQLYKDGEVVTSLTSNGRNVLEGPGDYEIEIGPLLRDGAIYKPVRQAVSITETGEKRISVVVTRPASVGASFSEKGEEVRGSNVSAWQEDKEVFSFRSFDEVFARPGEYEFRATPNADNELKVTATLIEAEHTDVKFALVNTVKVKFNYVLSNGESDQRTGQLVQNDEVKYSVATNRFNTVLPGTYTLQDKFADPLNSLDPIEVIIGNDEEQTIDVPMTAGFIASEYTGAERDFHNLKTTRVFVHAVDPETGKSKGSVTSATTRIEAAKPGLYRVVGHASGGYFDPVEVTVEANKTVTATLTAKPTADISITYAPGDYDRTPDRAFLAPLEGQEPNKTYMSPGKVLKVPPGRYKITPHGVPGLEPMEVNLVAGETKAIVLNQ